ncbi:MAG: M23 family metallopeptidase [Clostridia bacterium]|nr:M23 family metallopeptidase [Clostridia bacterium]
MKKKSLKPLIFALIFVPILIAAAAIWIFSANGEVTAVEINGGDIVYEDAETIELFTRIVDKAQKIDEPAHPIDEYQKYSVTLKRFFSEDRYTFCFSGSAADCLIKKGKSLYKIDTEDAKKLMMLDGLRAVSVGYEMPEIRVTSGENAVSLAQAQSVKWNYRLADSSFTERSHEPEKEISVEKSADDAIAIEFSLEPDWNNVTVTNADKIVYDGEAENLSSFIFNSDGRLDVKISARWNESGSREYFGELEAKFVLICDAPAEYTLSSQTAYPGELVTVLAKNCLEDEIELECGIAGISEKNVVSYGSQRIILIPIPLDTEPGEYSILIKADGEEQTLTFGVEKKKFGEVSLENVDADNMDRAFRKLEAKLEELSAMPTEEMLWDGEFITPMDEISGAWISAQFGSYLTADGKTAWARQLGLDYVAPVGSYIRASNAGKVVFAGTTEYTGNTVVIDHGLGIYTVYGNLETLLVSENTTVFKFQNIGTLGNTGFAGGRCLHFEARIMGVAVNPSSQLLGTELDFFDLRLSGN